MMPADVPPTRIGRYALFGAIGSGGMATVHLGRLLGPHGISKTVAIKRLHPHLSKDPEFSSMFLDEARLGARLEHPNVVSTFDVISEGGELLLVMEYVHGEALSRLISAANQQDARIPPRIVTAIVAGFLHGLHAAHEATGQRGEPLALVHRDVTPQNILVGIDGVARIADFGVAKALGSAHVTREGHAKGKLGYMAPEQIHGELLSRRTDTYAAGVVLWEALTGKRLFAGDNDATVLARVLSGSYPKPGAIVPDLPDAFDHITMRALSRNPLLRWETARDMALALERTGDVALPSEVGQWVARTAGSRLVERHEERARIEARDLDVVESKKKVAGTSPRRHVRRALALAAMTPFIAMAAWFGRGLIVGRTTTATFTTAPPVSASTLPEPSALAPHVASPTESSTVPSRPARASGMRPAPSSATVPSRATRNACDPPYTRDSSGRTIFKVECL